MMELAQNPVNIGGPLRGLGPLGLQGPNTATQVFNNVLSTTIGVMTIVAFIWFVIQFFLGAIGIIFSGGDKAKLQEARSKITTGIIGIVVVIAAIFLLRLASDILGIPDLLDPGGFVEGLPSL